MKKSDFAPPARKDVLGALEKVYNVAGEEARRFRRGDSLGDDLELMGSAREAHIEIRSLSVDGNRLLQRIQDAYVDGLHKGRHRNELSLDGMYVTNNLDLVLAKLPEPFLARLDAAYDQVHGQPRARVARNGRNRTGARPTA